MKKITEAASILGLTVVGALIPTVVNAKVPYVFEWGKVKMPVQDMIDSIMPNLLPVLFVVLIYWLLSKKGMNSTRVIIFIIVFAILFNFLGILG